MGTILFIEGQAFPKVERQACIVRGDIRGIGNVYKELVGLSCGHMVRLLYYYSKMGGSFYLDRGRSRP